jgi:tetratricopeptide (TPR) repeat protein
MMLNHLHARRIESAYEYGQRALELARQGGDSERLAFVLNDFARVLICRGEFDEAIAHIHEARGLWTTTQNRVMLADNLGAEEEALYSAGRFDEVMELGRQALEISEELDNAWGKSYHRLLMGLAEFERGDGPAAIQLMSEAVELGDQGGLIISSIAGRCDLAWCYGEVDRGLELVERALAVARANLPDWIVMPMAMKIRLHGLRNEKLEAEAAASEVELKPPSLAYPHYSMMVQLAQIELARLRGDYEDMLALSEAALQEMRDLVPAEAKKLVRCRDEALRALGLEDGE